MTKLIYACFFFNKYCFVFIHYEQNCLPQEYSNFKNTLVYFYSHKFSYTYLEKKHYLLSKFTIKTQKHNIDNFPACDVKSVPLWNIPILMPIFMYRRDTPFSHEAYTHIASLSRTEWRKKQFIFLKDSAVSWRLIACAMTQLHEIDVAIYSTFLIYPIFVSICL